MPYSSKIEYILLYNLTKMSHTKNVDIKRLMEDSFYVSLYEGMRESPKYEAYKLPNKLVLCT